MLVGLRRGFTELQLIVLDEPGLFKVACSFSYIGSLEVVVPTGFITDLASIPKILRGIFSQVGSSRKPAVVHDWLYRAGAYDRKTCDLLFKEMLIANNVGRYKASLYYYGVRIGGKWRYGK